MNAGEALEYRVANLIFKQGYFARRRVSIRNVFYPEQLDVTDVDVIGVKFDNNFTKFVSVWECKSGHDKPSIDRILWLSGLSSYIKANFRAIVFSNISDKIKIFGESVQVSIWSNDLLSAEEKLFDIKFMGPHDSVRYFQKKIDNYNIFKSDSNLMKIYWFQIGGFWFTDPELRVKKIITSISDCQERIIGAAERRAGVTELLLEGVVLLSIAILDLARILHVWYGNDLKGRLTKVMKSGIISNEEKNSLVMAAFQYVKENKGELPFRPENLLDVPEPHYTESLLNCIERFFEHPGIAIEVQILRCYDI